MDDSGRLDRLEARLDRLESELRNLMTAIDVARADALRPRDVEGDVPLRPASPAATRAVRPPSRAFAPGRDLEAWFGENALLVVGVLALVAAVGFALKHAFEQGWISPALRVLVGLVGGLALAAYGHVARRRGLHRFGGAAVGAGAAVAYLAAWAAAGPYGFVSPAIGVTTLAALSGLVLLSARGAEDPHLATMAALGAFVAPFVLGDASSSADLLLGYAAFVAGAVGAVAAPRGWWLAFAVVLAGFFGSALAAGGSADRAWLAAYLALGGTSAVQLARRRGWPGLEIVTSAAAWIGLVGTAIGVEGWRAWALAALPAFLVVPDWYKSSDRGPAVLRSGHALGRWFVVGAAVLWVVVTVIADPEALKEAPLVLAAAIGAVHLVPAVRRGDAALLTAGVAAFAVGILAQWDGSAAVTLGWAALVAVTALATTREPLAAARPAALGVALLAAHRLFVVDFALRPESEPAFLGFWSLALYALIGAVLLLALRGWTGANRRLPRSDGIDLHAVSWLLAGALVLGGGTVEIERLDVQEVVSSLAVSTFWLIYAGGLLAFGFRKERRTVRVAGLAVASLAILKVAFYDLANLEALYRVGSFALLAVITLVGARAYHARADATGGDAAAGGGGPAE